MELSSNPGVPRKFPGLPRKFPGLLGRSALPLGRKRTTPNLKARKAVPVLWPPFPLYARAFSPVVQHFC